MDLDDKCHKCGKKTDELMTVVGGTQHGYVWKDTWLCSSCFLIVWGQEWEEWESE